MCGITYSALFCYFFIYELLSAWLLQHCASVHALRWHGPRHLPNLCPGNTHTLTPMGTPDLIRCFTGWEPNTWCRLGEGYHVFILIQIKNIGELFFALLPPNNLIFFWQFKYFPTLWSKILVSFESQFLGSHVKKRYGIQIITNFRTPLPHDRKMDSYLCFLFLILVDFVMFVSAPDSADSAKCNSSKSVVKSVR